MVTLLELVRCILIYAHLLMFGVAIAVVLWSDLRIVKGEISPVELTSVAQIITKLFVGLWISGLTIIFVDTGFEFSVLAEKPKLLLKLASVTTLTINAFVLHKICFSILVSDSVLRRKEAIILSVCGALSTSHWLLAAFVGSASILNRLPISTLLSFYLLFCLLIIFLAAMITSNVEEKLNLQRAQRTLRNLGLRSFSTL